MDIFIRVKVFIKNFKFVILHPHGNHLNGHVETFNLFLKYFD